MYYSINFIFFYSLLGFILESVVYKYYNLNEHSSIFTGPYTFVYGFGMFFCVLVYNQIHIYLPNNILSYILYYILFVILTTITEYIGGHIIHYFLKIDKWDYTKKKYHFGKYICLKNSLSWGIIALFSIIYLHPFFHTFILKNIPKNATNILLLLFLIDFFFLIKKIIKK